MKRKICLVLIFVLVFMLVADVAWASSMRQEMESVLNQEDSGGIAGIVVTVLFKAIMWGIDKLGFVPVQELIFEQNTNFPLLHGVFSQEEWHKVVAPVINFGKTCAVFAFLFMLFGDGIRIMRSSTNPRQRANMMETFWRWFYVLFMLIFGVAMVEVMADLSWAFVSGFKTLFDVTSGASASIVYATGSAIATAILGVIFLFLTLYLNFIYYMRKFMIMVLLWLYPFSVMRYAISGDFEPVEELVKELAANIFMVPIHALIFGAYVVMTTKVASANFLHSWIMHIVTLVVMVPASEFIRTIIIGKTSNTADRLGMLATISGLGAIAGVGRLGGGTLKSALGIGGVIRGTAGLGGTTAGAATAGAGSVRAPGVGSSQLGGSLASSRLLGAVGLARNIGGAVAGGVGYIAGAVGGSVMGPWGAFIGGNVGSRVGGALGSGAYGLLAGGAAAGSGAFMEKKLGVNSFGTNEYMDNQQKGYQKWGMVGRMIGGGVFGEAGGETAAAVFGGLSAMSRSDAETGWGAVRDGFGLMAQGGIKDAEIGTDRIDLVQGRFSGSLVAYNSRTGTTRIVGNIGPNPNVSLNEQRVVSYDHTLNPGAGGNKIQIGGRTYQHRIWRPNEEQSAPKIILP